MKKLTLDRRNKLFNGKISGNGQHKSLGKAVKAPATQRAHPNGFSVRLLGNGEKQLTIQINGDRPQPVSKSVSPWLNPTQLERPAFLMNFPFSYATECTNNPWMEDLKGGKR